MKAMMNKLAYVVIAMIGFAGLVWAQEQVDPPSTGTVISEDTTVFAFGNYVKLSVPGVDHARYEITTNGVPMTSGGKTDGEFYVPADAVPVKVTYTPAPTFQFQNPTKTEWEYGSDETKEDEITLSKDDVLAGIGEITTGAPVEYFVWDEAQKQLVAQTCTVYEVVTAETKSLYNGIWYVVNDDVVIDGGSYERPGLLVNDDVHLILCDGASLVVTSGVKNAGIHVPTSASLSIYGQAGQTGVLTATGGLTGAGIGGSKNSACGRVTIHGGTVTANGGSDGAGIGGGDKGAGGTVTINGGTVTATGGDGYAGIGSGEDANSGVVTINGGIVTANGGSVGAGIGGGFESTGGTVTINGGLVIANGGGDGAGIGGGLKGLISSVTIAGGTVVANGGENAAGIGGGTCAPGCAVTIIAGDVTAVGGEGGEGIGKGVDAAPNAYGTFALGPFTEAGIGVGMDPTGGGLMPVAAEDFADQGTTIGWHAQRYVRVVAIKYPAPGSPEKPWDVGTNGSGQPQAVTNGNNEVIVTGEGLPKPYGENDPAPWAGFDPEIEKIYVPQGTEDIYKKRWTDDKEKIVGLPDYLSFTAKDGDVKIAFGKTYDGTYGLEYSFDPIADEWTALPEFDLNGTVSDADKVLVPNGQTLYIRKTGDEVTLGVGASGGHRGTFKMERVENTTATVEAGGNVMSLLDKTCRSKEVGDYAFRYLFSNCSILATAPKLSATKLGAHCYEFMFAECGALKVAPELPAMELADCCYYYMFYFCSSLESIELPAKDLVYYCYGNMFLYCHNLSTVRVGFDAWPTDDSCHNWLQHVASEGTFVCSQALENDFVEKMLSYGDSTIPVGWRFARDYLSFTAKDGDIKLTLERVNNPVGVAFEYSFNAGAESWTTYSESIQITKDQTVYFRKQGEAAETFSTNNDYYRFVFDGKCTVEAGGNVMSMLDPTCQSRKIGELGLARLFENCGRLVSAPRIDADDIGSYGCMSMFNGCTSLTTAPVIDAENIASGWTLWNMFSGAEALNEMTVGFKDWTQYRTLKWVQGVAPFGVFRCPSELPIEVGQDRIPEGWIVYKKFSIPVIEGLEHSVTNSAGEVIAPCAVSQDGTKTYEVAAGGEDSYKVFFEDVDGYPLVGNPVLQLGNLKGEVEIGSDKYPLPERGVLLTVEGAPEHSTCTIYFDEKPFFAVGADDLTTRVSSNATTKVVYKAANGWAYSFEGGQPVTEIVQLNAHVTEPTEVQAPSGDLFDYMTPWQNAVSNLKTVTSKINQLDKDKEIDVKLNDLKASPDPNVQSFIEGFMKDKDDFTAEVKKNEALLNASYDPEVVKTVEEATMQIGKNVDVLRENFLHYPIPVYTLEVENDPNMTTYSVYTGKTAQVTIVDKESKGGKFGGYVWETPVKVVYHLINDGYAFDDAVNKTKRDFTALEDTMQGDRLLAEPALGNLKELDGVYYGVKGQFAVWEKDAELMPAEQKKQIKIYIENAQKAVETPYTIGVPVSAKCAEITNHKDETWGKIEPLFQQGYQLLAQERVNVFKANYSQFLDENANLIKEIETYGTPEAQELLQAFNQLKKNCEDFIAQVDGIKDKTGYEGFLEGAQKLEAEMEDIANRITETIRYVTALPISAEQDFYGSVIVRSTQGFIAGEQSWIVLWFPKNLERDAISRAGELIGRKFREVPAEDLYQWCGDKCIIEDSGDYMLGDRYLPEGMTACVIAAIDDQGKISRVGGVSGLDTLAPGEVKGADIVGAKAMSISYYECKEGALYQNTAMAIPLTSGDSVTLAGVPTCYAVLGDCEIPSLNVKGDVWLILGRGCNLSVLDGIALQNGATLHICSEHDFRYNPHLTGRMTVAKTAAGTARSAAIYGPTKSDLEVHGGVIDITSDKAGIEVIRFFMYNGDVTVTGGEGFAGIYLESKVNAQCRVEAGTLNVTGGAGAAAIGGNVGRDGGGFNMLGGLVRANATPTEDGKCGASIGAGAGGKMHGTFSLGNGLSIFTAKNATSKMQITDAKNYGKMRHPSVLITTGATLIQPLPFTLTKKGGYKLQMPGKPSAQYVAFALTKDDLARAYGEGSTVGAEIWQTVSQIATGARVAVGEMTRMSLERSFREMGIKAVYPSFSQSDVCDAYSYDNIAMIVTLDCDVQGQIVRLGGINVPETMTDDSSIESPIGREAIGALTFELVREGDILKLQNLRNEPGEGETFQLCCYTKETIADIWETEDGLTAAVTEKICREVGTVAKYEFTGEADYLTNKREFGWGSYAAVVVLIYDEYDQVKRIGVATRIDTLGDGVITSNDAVLIGAQSFTVRAENPDLATIRMSEALSKGQAWLWVRVCDETMYEELDAFVTGLIGQPVGAEWTMLRPLDATEMPAVFGSGNWGLFTGENVQINRRDAKTGNPMRGVMVFKVSTLPMSATGSEMAILTVGGVKNVDKLADGKELSNQYGEDVEHIVNQPFTVTRMGDDAKSLQVAPEGELMEGERWYFRALSPDDKPVENFDERLSAYLGAAVGDLTLDTLGSWGCWPAEATETPFKVAGDMESVYLFKVDGSGNILSIGFAGDLSQLYETGMSKGDTFGKTFIAAQDFGVTRAGDVLTASVYGWDAFEAGAARDRFVCFTYADADTIDNLFGRLSAILEGTTEVGAFTVENLGLTSPTMLGTFTTDELSLELPADCSNVFVARVHGANDTIVTLGGLNGLGEISDGETRRPGEGFSRIRPFDFTVTRNADGTFTLETPGERRPNEQWLWAAVPPHVRYVMEQQFESSERLLERMRREMVEARAGTGKPMGASEFTNPEALQLLLGEGYYGTSLDTQLFVGNVPADAEIVLVFKIDRATGGLCSEGAVIDLDQLADGETKQNQIDGKVSYVEVDENGNRTQKETTVEPITDLTTSIGGGRWYVMTDLSTSVGGQDVVRRITVDGEANIVLLDSGMGENAKFSVIQFSGGFAVNEGATLNIYGQQTGNGVLQVFGADGCAAIGGDEGCGCGTINLYGGVVMAEAGAGAAAIGGGYLNGGENGSVGIYGGIVMAISGEAAAIGGGRLGCGCEVTIGEAATLFCANLDGEETPGVGGCDGLDNGSVDAFGENRVYLEADEEATSHPYDYYFGETRRNDFVTTELLTVSLPKDERVKYNVTSLTLGGDFGGVLPGDDAYTYKVLRGDTIVVTAETIGMDGLVNYSFRGPNVFKFDCVQSDVTIPADDLKVAPVRAVTPMDFTVSRDKFGNSTLLVNETFAPGEQLVWGVVPEGAKPPADDPMIVQLFNAPASFLVMLMSENLSVGEACCDEYAMLLGAKNWKIEFNYAGEPIPLPANARHVLAFKVYDGGRYASLAEHGKKLLQGSKKKADGRLALVKVGVVENVPQISPEGTKHNQLSDKNLIARQPFALTRNEDETFNLAPVGRLDVNIGEKWGVATIDSEKLAMIESGALGDMTVDLLKTMVDGMIGRPIGTVTVKNIQHLQMLFSKLETFDSNVFTCPKDTAAVLVFKTSSNDKEYDLVCTLGYTFGDLQAMTPGGTERKGNEIDGEVDAPTYFVMIENIPEGIKEVALSYAFGEKGQSVNLSSDVTPEGTALFAVPEGVNLRIEFTEPAGYIFRSKDSVRIKAIHQDELVDASFLVLAKRNAIEPQHFILRRNPDKTFAMEMPESDLDVEKGDRWFYLALNANDMAMSFGDGQPAGAVVWLLANQMIGQEVGSDDTVTTAYFMNAVRDGYSGYTTECFFGLPADAEMVIVCRCFDVTAEDGFTITYVETVGGCQNLQQTSEYDARDDEMNYPAGGEMFKVNYVKWDKAKSALVPGGEVIARVITDDTTTIGNDEWYVVPPMEEVTCGTITVQGTANLIVGDMAVFELEKFVVGEGATLNVYGQGQRLGTMIVGGDGVSIGSDTVCGTVNLHGVMTLIEGDDVGIGGMAKGGELNLLGANVQVMAFGPAIAGCTVNTYGGRLLAASMSGGAYPAINDDLAIKNGKMGLFASADPKALAPTKVADYLANRQPFAKIVEQVNVILPKVEHVKVTVASQDVLTGELAKVEPEDLAGANWLVYKVERFDNVMVEIAAETGYQLRSPNEYLFYSIDSDKQLPVDAIVVTQMTTPPQMIARQPFSIIRTTDENGPCCVLKPIGALGPGERWFWMSCDKTLAQTTGTIPDFEDATTEAAVIAMLNQAIGRAPVGYLSLDEYGLRAQLPINQSGVGTDAAFRLPADTDLVLLSKVYDGGLQDEGMVRYYNITLGLSTNLTAHLEQGDSGHNDIGEEPTDDEIKNALKEAFPYPHEVTQDEDGSFRITLKKEMIGPVAIPDNFGAITLDMNGYHIIGTNGVNGADGGNALVFTDSGDVGATTELTVVEANEKYNPEGDIVGGNGADGKVPGKGGAAIRVDTKRGVTINVEGTVLVIGGKGGTLLGGEQGTKPGDPGAGIEPQDTRGDRAPESVQDGEQGEDLMPWAKAKLDSHYSADEIAPLLPEGVTVVGSELWFWKRSGEKIGFDFRTIPIRWLDDYTIRFAAGTYLVDQFIYENDGVTLAFVGADSAAVVVNDQPFGPDKPVLKTATLGGKEPVLPDLGKYTVLVSTGKSIFQAMNGRLDLVAGPLGRGEANKGASWRNLGFTALPGTVIEGNGGAISAANVATLTVADCAFAGLTAGQLGGAIYAVGLDKGGLITNSTFTACSVDPASGLGGAIYAVGGKAPRLTAGSLGKPATMSLFTVVDCEFAGNTAESGGAIFSSPTYDNEKLIELEIIRTQFYGNMAHYNGGAICAAGKVTIVDAAAGEGTFFAYNEAGVYGGALAIDGIEEAVAGSEVSVGSNTVFACNKVENDWAVEALGGAINLPANCSLTVRNALFTNNVAVCGCEALDAYGAYGGAISTADGCLKYIEKTAFVDNAAIVENATSGNRYAAGGALSECGGVTLIDTCVFDGNTVSGEIPVGGALDLEYDEEATVLNSTFRNSNWEAVSVYDASAVIRNCVIVGNSVSEKWYDLYLDVGEVELTFSAYGNHYQAPAAVLVSSNNLAGVTADQVYDGETLRLATNVYNAVAALGYPQPGVTDFNGVEYGSTFWGTSMGAFETPAIYPVEQLGFEITVDPQELAWTGLKVHPTSIAVTNPLTRAELTEGVDYTVAFENDTDATDQARVVVTGIGDYSGVATTNYWITSYLVKYYACEKETSGDSDNDRLLEEVQLGSLSGSNVVAKIVPLAGYTLDPFHAGSKTNGTVSLYDRTSNAEANGRLVLRVFYAKSSGGDDDIPDKYQRKITYKVVNGWWDGDEKNGIDKTVWVTLFDEDGKWSENGTGTLSGIPEVGQTPFAGYAKTGVWYPATPTTVEMSITRSYPAQPFFLYVYCPQPEGGAGRAGRGGTGTVTEADLNALKSHLQTRFDITSFSVIGPNVTGAIVAGVIDDLTGNLLASEPLEGAKVNVKSTTDLASGEWASSEVPTDSKGLFSFPKPEGVDQFFIQVEPAGK